jgi:16S rRNA (guanine1207-N2)-methyltransferase
LEGQSFVPKVLQKIRHPVVVILGGPREVAELIQDLEIREANCYQLDLYQAERLRKELGRRNLLAQVTAGADLWDLPAEFETAIFPAATVGERSLKIDMVEQGFHVLRPLGTFLALSAQKNDQLFPGLLKKVFGRVHASPFEEGSVLWSRREGDRPRRRHEVTFHARVGEGPSLHFLSRPGVFAYGRMDDGARALVETMQIEPGDRILDIGCGCGTNGIFAAKRSGRAGRVVFVDSNVRAVALTELNARANEIDAFEAVASAQVDGFAEADFDVVLANPPYYAQGSIAGLFIERARALLRPRGRVFLVTKQPDVVGPMMAECFGRTDVVERRGYVILCARAR